MTSNQTIISMLAFINNNDLNAFYKVAGDYAETLSKTGNVHYRIKRTINQKPRKLNLLNEVPVDLKKLIQIPELTDDNIYLNNEIKLLIDELLIEWNNLDAYKFHNIPVRNKILFHGPTGNGKTTIAKHISKLSKLPFIEINSDIIIDSHLGNTGQNIHKIFNQINEPCILFWDEVDTIGRKRGIGNDNAAGLENERMVNSILVNIEKLHPDVIFIGATNRYDVLDSAFLRRFDVKFELTAPALEQKRIFSKQLINYYKINEHLFKIDLSSVDSYSDLKMLVLDYARKYIISKLKNV